MGKVLQKKPEGWYVYGSQREIVVMNPTIIAYGALGLAIVSEVIGSSMLVKSEQFTKLVPSIAMGVFFIVSMFFLSQALRVLPLGVAYAIWAGVGIVLTSVVGLVVFRQTLDLAAMAGIGLIVSGVVVMRVFSQTAGH